MATTTTPMMMMAANISAFLTGGGGPLPLHLDKNGYLSEPNISELGQVSMRLFMI